MMGGKARGTRGGDRDGERVSVPQDYFFLLKIIPCSPVGTHTQTTTQPSVLSLSISRTGDKSFRSELASGQSGPRARECAREPRHRRRVSEVDVASSIGYERKVRILKERGVYSSFSSPCVMT